MFIDHHWHQILRRPFQKLELYFGTILRTNQANLQNLQSNLQINLSDFIERFDSSLRLGSVIQYADSLDVSLLHERGPERELACTTGRFGIKDRRAQHDFLLEAEDRPIKI